MDITYNPHPQALVVCINLKSILCDLWAILNKRPISKYLLDASWEIKTYSCVGEGQLHPDHFDS